MVHRQGSTAWRLLLDESAPGPWNMGVDEALLASARRSQIATLRFYTWDGPWLSLGYAQRRSAEQLAACRASGVGCVRRTTGGRAVLHGADLTYSIAAPIDRLPHGLGASYGLVSEALLCALSSLGVPAVRVVSDLQGVRTRSFDCFADPGSDDLCIGGRKVSGSAQRRVGGALLQHGSLRLADDPGAAAAAGLSSEQRAGATSLAREGFAIPLEELRRACCAALEAALRGRFEPSGLSPAERREALARGFEPGILRSAGGPRNGQQPPLASNP
jgi:lipoate-protein ligase A